MIALSAMIMAVCAMALARRMRSVRFPGAILLLLFAALLYSTEWTIVDHGYELQWHHAAYLMLCLGALVGGMVVGARGLMDRRRDPRRSQETEDSRRLVALVGLGALGGLLYAGDISRHFSGRSDLAPTNLSSRREIYMEYATTWQGRGGSVLFGASLPALAMCLAHWLKKRHRGIASFAYASASVLMMSVQAMIAVLSGGRQIILEQIVLVGAVLLYARKREVNAGRRYALLGGGVLVAAVGTGYMLWVASSRAEHGGANASYLLAISSGQIREAEVARYAEWSSARQTLVVASALYGPYNVTSFAVYLDSVASWKLGYGRHNLLHLARNLERLGVPLGYAFEPQYEFPGRIDWPTFVGTMLVDFGRGGTPIVLLLLGVPIGKAYRAWLRGSNRMYEEAFLGLTLVFMVHGLMYSPFQETLLIYGLGWLLWFKWWPRLERPAV